MEIELSQIVHIGFADGLIWFPFVLGIGLLLTYLKEIDVSIDGIVVISGIVSAFLWRSYESYELSLLGGTITGLLGSSVVSAMQILLRIPGLMAGIILSLIAHSLSVLLIGESLVLPDTQLLSGFGVIEIWQVVLVVVLAGLSVFFYNMRFGMAIRKYGDGSLVNTVYSANLLKWSAYLVSGGLYGLGGALYVHSQGVAKSGGSFEFLIIALSAYLCTVRLGDLFHKVVSLVTWVNRFSVEFFSAQSSVVNQLVSSPALKAFIGAIVFETLLFLTITYSPNPMMWKLLFGVLLLLALATYPSVRVMLFNSANSPEDQSELSVRKLNVHYDIGVEKRDVFVGAEIDFGPGINLIRGPNGTGKSTFLKTISGSLAPDSGIANYRKKNLFAMAPQHRPCFFLHQNPFDTLAQGLTAVENLFVVSNASRPFRLINNKRSVLTELEKQLALLGLPLIYPISDLFWYKPVKMLSGGEAHCVALYCAILSGKSILLADEPTSGLDAVNFDRMITIYKQLAENKMILLTSHESRVSEIADRTYVIGNCNIAVSEGPDDHA